MADESVTTGASWVAFHGGRERVAMEESLLRCVAITVGDEKAWQQVRVRCGESRTRERCNASQNIAMGAGVKG